MNPDVPSDSPLVQPFLAGIKDDTGPLGSAMSELRAAASAVTDLRSRALQIREQGDRIAGDFAEADGRDREALLSARASIDAERSMLPGMAEAAAWRYVSAVIDWARECRATAKQERDRAMFEMEPVASAAKRAATTVDRFGISAESVRMQSPQRVADARQQLDELNRQLAPLQERVRLASDAVSGVDIAISRLFGYQDEQRRAAVSIDPQSRRRLVRRLVATILDAPALATAAG